MRERVRIRTLRCAIYTRKSSEEGLEQDFNSLQAQREACESYIASQKHEGWKLLPAAFDDGAYSGGTMERPALKRMLSDISSGRIDVVVVYKVDRLTRALADFAKIVEIFDRHGVSFVSVTQQFNTTSSMGRLTLNVLLSFAQFEREVTGERIRDKIAASKKKGLWMGGFVPLGYRANERTLIIHEPEVKVVRTVFALYQQLGTVQKVQTELERRGVDRPATTAITTGRVYGGRPFSRGEIYKLLANPIYVGEIHHKGQRYEGQHPAIIDPKTWNAVRSMLAANTHARHIGAGAQDPSLLARLLYDDEGKRYTPSHTVKKGKRYRYYARHDSTERKSAPHQRPHMPKTWRISATEIETAVIGQLTKHLQDPHWIIRKLSRQQNSITNRKSIIAKGEELTGRMRSYKGAELRELLLSFVRRVTLRENGVRIDIHRAGLMKELDVSNSVATLDNFDGSQSPKYRSAEAKRQFGASDGIAINVPISLRRRGIETRLIIDAGELQKPSRPDPTLIKLLANAHQWWDDLLAGRYRSTREVAQAYGKDERYVARVLPLVFFASSIVDQIVAGTQPIHLIAQRLIVLHDIPHAWYHQLVALGFDE